MADLLTAPAQCRVLAALAAGRAGQARSFAAEVGRLAELLDLVELEVASSGLEQFVELELAGTMRLGQQHAGGLLMDARRMRDVLSRTLTGLAEGELWVAQATLLLTETRGCSVPVAREVETRVLDAGGAALCPGDLRRRVRRTVLAVQALFEPAQAAGRESDARAGRRVTTSAQPDGMASLWALLPAEQALRHHAALEELVRLEREADRAGGIERTADQRRADVLASLPGQVLAALRAETATARTNETPDSDHDAAGAGPGPAEPGVRSGTAPAAAGRPGGAWTCGHGSATEIIVLMPFATLTGHSTEPAAVPGHGPISAAQALALVPDARLRLAAVDASTGEPRYLDPRTEPAGPDLTSARAVLSGWLDQHSPPASSPASADADPDTARPHTPHTPTVPTDLHLSDDRTDLEDLPDHDPYAYVDPEDAGGTGGTGDGDPGGDSSSDGRPPPGGPGPGRPPPARPARPLFVRDTAEPQYQPSAALARFVRVRDPLCTGIGCSTSSWRCDLDHLRSHRAGGPTSAGNLGPKSRHCHRAKTQSWTCMRTYDGGHLWLSPLGRTYLRPSAWDPPPGPDRRPPVPAPPPGTPVRPSGQDGERLDAQSDLYAQLRRDLGQPDTAGGTDEGDSTDIAEGPARHEGNAGRSRSTRRGLPPRSKPPF